MIPTSEADYLEQDPPIRGQNFACLSFISPEEVLKDKETYIFKHFITNFSKEMDQFFTQLSDKYIHEKDLIDTIKGNYSYLFDNEKIHDEYQFYKSLNEQTLESKFHEDNDFKTSIRGIKIRGVFDTLKEAEVRAQVLKRMDDKFHVYVAQVGCWCPWAPNPDDITNQEYAETQLNTLMKNYKDNQDKKDQFFEERKRDLQFFKPTTSDTIEANIVTSLPTDLEPLNAPRISESEIYSSLTNDDPKYEVGETVTPVSPTSDTFDNNTILPEIPEKAFIEETV